MIIKVEEDVKAYLEKTGTKRLLIDMTPDMTNSGCGCGKTKKFYTPYIRPLKKDESVDKYSHFRADQLDLYFSQKAVQASDDLVTIKLEKSLFVKNLALEGIRFIVES